MKFLLFIICSFSLNISLNYALEMRLGKPTNKWFNTPAADWGNSKTWFLERHFVKCPPGSAISIFKLTRPSSKTFSYKYQCVISSAVNIEKNEKDYVHDATPFNSSKGDYFTNYLDRHKVDCPKGYALTSFKLERGGEDNKQVRYKYTCAKVQTLCCHSKNNSKTDAGRKKETRYLENQTVGIENINSNLVLTGFQLHSTYRPNKYHYSYNYCKLLDIDALKDLQKVKEKLEKFNEVVTKAKAAIDLIKAEKVAQKQEIKSIKNHLRCDIDSLNSAKEELKKREDGKKNARNSFEEKEKIHKNAAFALATAGKNIIMIKQQLEKTRKTVGTAKKNFQAKTQLLSSSEFKLESAKKERKEAVVERKKIDSTFNQMNKEIEKIKKQKMKIKAQKDDVFKRYLRKQTALLNKKQDLEHTVKKRKDVIELYKKVKSEYFKAKHHPGLKKQKKKNLSISI